MKLYNASLESFKLQCDSKVFRFHPRSFTEVPDDLANLVYEMKKDWGVFIVYPGMSKEAKKQAVRTALLSYLGGALHERIKNYASQADEFRKKGITLEDNKHSKEAKRWDKEIREVLEMEAPIYEELSYLDAKRRKKLGIDAKNVKHVEENIFDSDEILEANKIVGPKKIKKEEPKQESFTELDLDEEIK